MGAGRCCKLLQTLVVCFGPAKVRLIAVYANYLGGYHCTFRAVFSEAGDKAVDLPFAHSIPFSEHRDDVGHFLAAGLHGPIVVI